MKSRILVVEDEPAIRMGLCDVLAYHGYDPVGVDNGSDGLREGLTGGYDLLLLDVMLPGVDGLTICEQVRKRHPRQGILMLTARGSEGDVLEGFRRGADDYVPKPFSVAQVVARVEALLRRSSSRPQRAFQLAGLDVDPDNLRVTGTDRSIDLTPRDIELLTHFATATGRVVTRDELLIEVWGYTKVDRVETRCVDMQIAKLRKKLTAITSNSVIETVRGAGYRVIG
jgi:two-component system response regulator RegX3